MQGRGTSAGSTEIVLVTSPPAPPLAAACSMAPSLSLIHIYLPIGQYTLTYTATGFNVQKTQHIAVQADRTATVNATLKVGETTTTVEVEATPLMNAVDTTNGYVCLLYTSRCV